LRRARGDKGLLEELLTGVLGASRMMAKQVMSMANLRLIGECVRLYSALHDDRFPPDLNALIRQKLIEAESLISPASGRVPETDEEGLLMGPADYVYIRYPDGAEPEPGLAHQLIVAYERPEIYQNEGTNVLYIDGRAEHVSFDEFQRQLEQTRAWLRTRAGEGQANPQSP
jgi:hypothetical protein